MFNAPCERISRPAKGLGRLQQLFARPAKNLGALHESYPSLQSLNPSCDTFTHPARFVALWPT
jgi:hypothetical protein